MNTEDLCGVNVSMPILKVKHADLKRVDDSHHKSICPVCNTGWLLMMRDQDTLKLRNIDRCILCGQLVKYTDIPDNKLLFL